MKSTLTRFNACVFINTYSVMLVGQNSTILQSVLVNILQRNINSCDTVSFSLNSVLSHTRYGDALVSGVVGCTCHVDVL